MRLLCIASLLCLAAASAPYPTPGTRVSLLPFPRMDYVLMNCGNNVATLPSPGGMAALFWNGATADWMVVGPMNNNTAQGSVSLSRVDATAYLAPTGVGTSSVGVVSSGDADDLSWLLVPGVENATLWTFVTQSKRAGLAGAMLTLNASHTSPCIHDPSDPASGDLVLAARGAPNAITQTFAVGPPTPALTLPAPASPADQPGWLAQWGVWRDQWRQGAAFNDTIYALPALTFVPSLHAAPLVPIYDRLLFDAGTGAWTVDKFLDDATTRYGGLDGVWLWATYPNLGVDDRNQFQVFGEDLPGGVEGLRGAVADFHARGVRVGLGYNPWDMGTSPPANASLDDAHALAALGAAVGLDLVNGDTMNLIPREFLDASVAVGRPLAYFPEMGPTLGGLDTMPMTNGYWPGSGPAPDVDALKWVERRFQTLLWYQSGAGEPDFHNLYFNGIGFGSPENLWGTWQGLSPHGAESCRRVLALLRFLDGGGYLVAQGWEPFAPMAPEAASAGLYASRWPTPPGAAFPSGNATAWTIISHNTNRNFTGPTLLVPCPSSPNPTVLYYDLYLGLPLTPTPYTSGGGGGGVGGCSVNLTFVEGGGYGAVLAAPASGANGNATLSAFLARMAAMTTTPLSSFSTLPAPALQTMSPRNTTPPATSPPPGMVLVPANPAWNYSVRAAFIGYVGAGAVQFPWESVPSQTHAPKILPMAAFYMDVTPVTNAQYAGFLNSSGYAPLDTHNFLRDWASPSAGPPSGWGAKPVTWVDLVDAGAYCAHYGKRLPNDWEWQYAFQGSDGRTYPWGHTFNASLVPPQQSGRIRPPPVDVGSYPGGASVFGVQDGMGLVWQWTSEFMDNRTRAGLVRGGSWWAAHGSDWYFFNDLNSGNYITSGPVCLSTYSRLLLMAPSYDRHGTVGFRCITDT